METVRSIVFFCILSTLVEQLVDGTGYKLYVNLVIGFMLLSLMIRPILSFTGNDKLVETALFKISEEQSNISFQSDALEEKEKQLEAEMEKILKSKKIQIESIKIQIDQKDEIKEIYIKTGHAKKDEKMIKTILLEFYNVKESNINISE